MPHCIIFFFIHVYTFTGINIRILIHHHVLQIAIFHVAEGPFVEVFTQCVTHGFYTEAWQEQLYASFSLFFMFLLPLAILITTYVSTVITLSRKCFYVILYLFPRNCIHERYSIFRYLYLIFLYLLLDEKSPLETFDLDFRGSRFLVR